MRLRESVKARRAVRWLKERLAPTATILLYHRVINLPSDPYRLAVTPEHFAEHLEVLRRHYRPMRLDQLVEAWRVGKLPPRAVAVTMDDGYFDNWQFAQPLLARYEVPMTVFVVLGNLLAQREFWWDELEQLFLQPGTLPPTLQLQLDGQQYQWELGTTAHYSEEEWQVRRDWHYGCPTTPTPRQQVFYSVWQLLHTLSETKRDAVLEQLFLWANKGRHTRATHRALTSAELLQLAEDELVELGAHTMTHPVLAKLSIETQQQQIKQSKTLLEELLGQPVNGFSYPHGLPGDYTSETVAITRAAGFSYACAAFGGIVDKNTDSFQLPRYPIADCDGEEFARWLQEQQQQ